MKPSRETASAATGQIMRQPSAARRAELIPRSNHGRRIDEDVTVRRPSATLAVVVAWTALVRAVDRYVDHGGQLVLGIATAGVLAGLLSLHPRTVLLQTLAVV